MDDALKPREYTGIYLLYLKHHKIIIYLNCVYVNVVKSILEVSLSSIPSNRSITIYCVYLLTKPKIFPRSDTWK